MAFCTKCGVQLADDAKFCSACGTAVPTEPAAQQAAPEQAAQQTAQQTAYQTAQQSAPQPDIADNIVDAFNTFNNTEDETAAHNAADIQENKVLALFAYIGILFLVPLLAAPNSKFARFHTNQGIVLLIAQVIVGIGWGIINSILTLLFRVPYNFYLGTYYALPGWLSFVLGLCSFLVAAACIAMSVLGIVNACTGKAKRLPIVGRFTILK